VDAVRFRRFVLPTLVGAAAYFAIFGGEYSLLDLWRLQRQHERELAELKRLQDSLAVLRARVDSLERDPALIERLARERYGLIREGERLYLFAEPSDSAPERGGRGEQARNVGAR
jgi:cell division protein FtsB